MKSFKISLVLFSILGLLSAIAHAIQTKGAIIIASMEGEVTVTNNETGNALTSDRVKAGGLIFDGHTVTTGPGSKAVLLFSSGTITTLKAESVLNIKKFAQEKFDPKTAGKLGDRKDEPSPSETIIDLNLGDMVVDVKKLKKESSFNIDSPVGTAGIRGTVPAIQVLKLPDGGFTQNTSMLRGEIAFTPRAGGPATFLGPGQSLSIGIGANGLMLPAMLGRVDASVMKAIEAEVEQAAAATGAAPAESEPAGDTPQGASEEDAPSEDELNESDDERQASAKGLDDNGTETVALEKAGLLDSKNPDDMAKAETFIEVAKASAEINDEESEANKDFVGNLVTNFKNVVDVTEESEDLGLKDKSKIQGFAKSSEQSGDLLAVLGDADQIGAKNADNMDAVFSNPDKATNLKKVIDVAKDAFASGRRNSDGDDEVTQDGRDTMTAMFRTAEKANEVAAVVESAEATKSTDSAQGEKKVLGVFKVVNSVDKAEQDQKAAEIAAQKAAEEAATKKAAEEAAAQKADDELAAAQAAGNAEAIAAAQDAADAAAKKKEAVDDYSTKLTSIKTASDSASVDALLAEFNAAHDADIVSLLASDGFDLSVNADARRSAIKAEASAAQKENVFGNLETVSDLAVSSIEVEEQAAAAEAAADVAAEAAVLALADAEASGDADALARAKSQKAAAERAKADAQAKAADTGFDNMIENADQATALKEMVDKNAEIEAAAQKAKDEADVALAVAQASGDEAAIEAAIEAQKEAVAASENKADLGSLLKNADKAEDLARVVEAAESLSSGDSSTLTALLKNPDQASKLADVVESSSTAGGEGETVQDAAKLNVLFNVVKSSDAKKVAAQKQATDAEATGAFVPFEIEELILTNEDKSILMGWKSGNVNGVEFSDESLKLLETLIDNRIEEINAKNVFEKIDTVVEVAKNVQDNGGGTNLDSILDNADKADDLKVLVDQAVSSGGEDGAASLLTNVLDNAEKATELSEVVSSAADEGVDVTQFLENANEADSLLKAKKAADEVAAKAEEDARSAIEAAGDTGLTEEEIVAQIEAAKKAAKKEVMQTVADNAANAESVATVLEAAEGADAETKAALLRNADQAVAMANTIREEEAIKKAAEDKATEEALLAEAAAQALEEQLASASAEEQAAIQAEIEAVRLAAEQRRLAEEQFTEDLRTATSLAEVDEALNTYKLILDEGEEVPETISNFVTSRKKNLSIINVAKQMDAKKQEAKAVAAKAEQADVSEEFREAAQTKESMSELKTLLSDNLPDAITDSDLKAKIFRAKTEDKVRELLADYELDTINSAVDHWMIVFPVKEEINAALAFASIEVMAEVAASTAAVAEVVVVDDGLSQEAKDAISQAQEDLDFAETIDEVDAILATLESLEISIPDGITSFAESKKKSITALNAVLDNAEQAAQVAVLLESEDSGSEGGIFDSLSSGGDDFDFDEVIASGALGTLQGQRFEDLSLNFEEFYLVDSSNQQTVVVETVSSLGDLDEQYLVGVQNIKDAEGGKVYQLTAEQLNTLTGSTDAVEGIYSFSEFTDPDTGLASGVTISLATKKLGVTDTASEGAQDYTGFAVEPDRAADVLFILDSQAIKILETDSAEEIAKKDDLRSAFLQNSDQLDNLLELNKVIGEDQNKVEIAFANIGSIEDLVVVSDKLRFDESKLNQVYDYLDNTEVDDATKSTNLSYYRSLTEKLFTSPKKLNAVFENENVGKLEVLDDLTNRLDRNVEGVVEEKGQLNFLFNNLDKSDDILSIVNRFEGVKRDTVLRDIRNLVTTNPSHRDIIFANPSQASSLRKLSEEFKFEPARVEIIFEFADKADAFLSVLNDLKGDDGTGSFTVLFSDTVATMENQGLAKLKAEYPEKYWSVFDENKEIAAEIAATASKFKNDEAKLALVFENLDQLGKINDFANEFGAYEIVTDEEGEETEIFTYDDTIISIFFANIGDLSNLIEFKTIGERVGIPGGVAMTIFSSESGYLDLGKLDEEFLGNLYNTGVDLLEIPLVLAEELQKISLTAAELKQVVSDLILGPSENAPASTPGEEQQESPEFATLSFLLNHDLEGKINKDLVISAELAFASKFFTEALEVYDALSALSEDQSDYLPSDSEIVNSLEEAVQRINNQVDNSEGTNPSLDNSVSESVGVLGGRKIAFGAGEYDLSLLAFDNLLVASTDLISLSGSIIFDSGENDIRNELILLSAGGIAFTPSTSVEFTGESLGFGSFDSMEIIDVDLYAEDEISARSLDSLVIKNSDMATSGHGSDFVHLLAYNELAVDNLRFSEQIKQITMEAMTINLYNLNFPSGSMVKLNSEYGGIDGKYPNFGPSIPAHQRLGRVNFVENIRYSSNPIMDRPSFDQFGQNVSIGKLGQ